MTTDSIVLGDALDRAALAKAEARRAWRNARRRAERAGLIAELTGCWEVVADLRADYEKARAAHEAAFLVYWDDLMAKHYPEPGR